MTKVYELPRPAIGDTITPYESYFLSPPDNDQNKKYVGIGCFVFDNGDMCEYGRTRDGTYEFLGLVFTEDARKACVLQFALKRLEAEKEREHNKEVRLQAIEALRMLIN